MLINHHVCSASVSHMLIYVWVLAFEQAADAAVQSWLYHISRTDDYPATSAATGNTSIRELSASLQPG